MSKPPTVSSLTVTIEGHGPASGKTTLQTFLAEFLASRGCQVYLSDDSVSEHIFKSDMRRYAMTGPTKLDALTVSIHVSGTIPPNDHPAIKRLLFRDMTTIKP